MQVFEVCIRVTGLMSFHRRSEMESALWHAFSRHGDDERRVLPPPVFLNRIKRMLDLERKFDNAEVFAEQGTYGKGYVAEYSMFSVFLMALALTLLDSGLKQQDVLFLLVHIREQLKEVYDRILQNAPRLNNRPNSPVQPDKPLPADTAIFLLIAKVEMVECWPSQDDLVEYGDGPDRMILDPIFCFGISELTTKVKEMGFQRPSYLVVEIADLAVLIRRHLGRDQLFRAMAKARELKQFSRNEARRKTAKRRN